PENLADKYTRAYLEDIDQMNIKRADAYCTATVNIEQMIKIIEGLVENGYAYEVEGNVYFSVEKFSDYGKLSGRNLEDMDAGSGVGVNEEKKHPLDFALWKKAPVEDVRVWDSPWGPGWPGWHIECSAMAAKLLDKRIDIHGGGTDLIFPHHENEIAQSEACFGEKPFVKYWLHNGTIDMKGEKMSKSLGNFFTTRELLQKFTADEIRYFLLSKHYHSPVDFSLEEIENSAVSWHKIMNTKQEVEQIVEQVPKKSDLSFNVSEFLQELDSFRDSFAEAMDDDFNTARAIGVINNLTGKMNSLINRKSFKVSEETRFVLKKAVDLLDTFLEVLGFAAGAEESSMFRDDKLTGSLLDYILDLREQAREDNNWELADQIRDDLDKMGISVKDTTHGPVWSIEDDEYGS
ncbi:MAG: cysteine--tRNA ligase, partial [Bacillota bacterium]